MDEKKLTTRQLIELQDKYLMKSVEAWNDKVFVEGHGAVVTDLEGQEYIDCFSGVSVLNVGHTHPKVVQAVCDQMGKLTHMSTLYRTVPMPLLAKKLSEISPMDRGKAKVFFCNSGTEANEHALTLARIATGKFELDRPAERFLRPWGFHDEPDRPGFLAHGPGAVHARDAAPAGLPLLPLFAGAQGPGDAAGPPALATWTCCSRARPAGVWPPSWLRRSRASAALCARRRTISRS